MKDRSDPAVILVSDGVEDEPFVRFEGDAHRPPLPAQHVAFDREARALGLGDLDRFEVVTPRFGIGRLITTTTGRNGDGAVIDDIEHLTAAEIDERDDSFDRSRVLIVVRIVAQIRDCPTEPPAVLFGQPEAPGRPSVDLDLGEVIDAAQAHRLLPTRVGPHGLRGQPTLFDQDRRAHPCTSVTASTFSLVNETSASVQAISGPVTRRKHTRRSMPVPSAECALSAALLGSS